MDFVVLVADLLAGQPLLQCLQDICTVTTSRHSTEKSTTTCVGLASGAEKGHQHCHQPSTNHLILRKARQHAFRLLLKQKGKMEHLVDMISEQEPKKILVALQARQDVCNHGPPYVRPQQCRYCQAALLSAAQEGGFERIPQSPAKTHLCVWH